MAFDEIKKGENTQLMREVANKIDGRLGSDYTLDEAWCDDIDRRAEQKKEKLENELNSSRVLIYSMIIHFMILGFVVFYLLGLNSVVQ